MANKWVGVVFLMVLVAFTLQAGGTSEAAEDAPRILQAGQVGDYASLAVHRNTTQNHIYLENVYDQILFNERARGFTNEAVESFEMAPDKTSCRFTLRPTTTHDGTVANAQMVVDVWNERLASDEYGASPHYNQIGFMITRLEAVDEWTVEMEFSDPIPTLEAMMSLLSIHDIDMHRDADGNPVRLNEQPTQIGTGPFRLVEYVPGSHAYYEKFEGYWDADNVKLDGINIRFFGDNSAMIAALEAGEVDYVFRPSFDDIERFSDNPNFTVVVPDTMNSAFVLMMSPKIGITQNPLVRQAINYAINRNSIAEVVTHGMTQPIATPALPGSMAYESANEVPYDGDQRRARQLLAQSGEDLSQEILITYPSNDAAFRLICEVIADNMRAIGLNPVLDPMDNTVYAQKRVSGDFQLLPSLISGLNVHPAGLRDSFVFDPTSARLEEFFNPDIVTPENRALFERYRDTFMDALAATDDDEEARLFRSAMGILREGAWVTTLCGNANTHIMSTRVTNFTWSNQDKPVFRYVELED